MSTETKSEKFIRIRDARLPKIVAAIKLLGNLAGPGYEYTETEAQELVSELDTAVTKIYGQFGLATPDFDTAVEFDADSPHHTTDRATLDRSILQLKIDRALNAVESLPDLFKELKEEMGAYSVADLLIEELNK